MQHLPGNCSNSFTYLTPWSKDLLNKLKVAQLLNKFRLLWNMNDLLFRNIPPLSPSGAKYIQLYP